MPHERAFPISEEELDDAPDEAQARIARARAPHVTWALVVANGAIRCSICTETAILAFRRARVDDVVRELRAFAQKHSVCKPLPRPRR